MILWFILLASLFYLFVSVWFWNEHRNHYLRGVNANTGEKDPSFLRVGLCCHRTDKYENKILWYFIAMEFYCCITTVMVHFTEVFEGCNAGEFFSILNSRSKKQAPKHIPNVWTYEGIHIPFLLIHSEKDKKWWHRTWETKVRNSLNFAWCDKINRSFRYVFVCAREIHSLFPVPSHCTR